MDDASIVMVEPGAASQSSSGSYRLYTVTGKRAGSGNLQALDFNRQGTAKTLDSAALAVAAAKSTADMTYTGKWLVWERSLPASMAAAAPHFFAATSGLLGHQVARQQREKDHGPLPEGTYELSASIDPRQASVHLANALGDESTANTRDGIQFLRVGGNGPVDRSWGTMRVRLRPVQGNMFGRGGFYLHNSTKGYSHGCVEVGLSSGGVDFFTALQSYVMQPLHKPTLTVHVKYSFPEQTTLGQTLR
jgi:hypothetical protein